MISNTKLEGRAADGREVVSSCLLALSKLQVPATGVSGVRGGLGADIRDERPTKALLVAAAQAPAYAAAAAGADLQQEWANGAFAGGIAATTTHMRAFRGPDPWKEPS
ncbi:hypothetical protein OG946_25730 [Streptomyces sp. NBC_01808]|uniref:hypothetical protein n=1 Tax=Streptomyces sp. NBC_01808 TaxID=2975947 RepID=UPI002DDC65F2|nr:hypothetical protein [Streptomyces sp. NBC_01808]WSA40470.1 hypothetical protein OG946_25730 [Streptomyces sp. NBC_01808]